VGTCRRRSDDDLRRLGPLGAAGARPLTVVPHPHVRVGACPGGAPQAPSRDLRKLVRSAASRRPRQPQPHRHSGGASAVPPTGVPGRAAQGCDLGHSTGSIGASLNNNWPCRRGTTPPGKWVTMKSGPHDRGGAERGGLGEEPKVVPG
jgi:hypothetical protein